MVRVMRATTTATAIMVASDEYADWSLSKFRVDAGEGEVENCSVSGVGVG